MRHRRSNLSVVTEDGDIEIDEVDGVHESDQTAV